MEFLSNNFQIWVTMVTSSKQLTGRKSGPDTVHVNGLKFVKACT